MLKKPTSKSLLGHPLVIKQLVIMLLYGIDIYYNRHYNKHNNLDYRLQYTL